jgi:chromosome segregation ATPase
MTTRKRRSPGRTLRDTWLALREAVCGRGGSRSARTALLASAVLALGPHAGPAAAQAARSGGGASAQLVQQLQQLASERTALQAENARMKKELAELTKERDTLKSGRSALDQRSRASEAAIARSAQETANAESELAKQKERMQQLVEKFRETAQTLRDVETERATFKQSLNTREADLATCTKQNEALFALNDEVLTRLEGTGPISRIASAEPFTKLKRTQLENLIDEYRYRAEDQKVSAAPR